MRDARQNLTHFHELLAEHSLTTPAEHWYWLLCTTCILELEFIASSIVQGNWMGVYYCSTCYKAVRWAG